MTSEIIANALFKYLTTHIGVGKKQRHFFRVDNFDPETYHVFLTLMEREGNKLAGRPAQVRTITPLNGWDQYAREAGKSATWYRNNVKPGEVLILIFNESTSDAQSLKDIYPVTEGRLTEDGFRALVDAAFQNYQLNADEFKTLQKFLERLKKQLFQPQLRDLTSFLVALDRLLSASRAESIEHAIAESLPELGLFRCRSLTGMLNQTRGDKQLKALHQAAQQGREVLEARKLNEFMSRLEDANFEDDSPYGGLSADQKRALLAEFLNGVMTDRAKLLQVLQLDWQEVSPVLHKKAQTKKADRFRNLAEDIEKALRDQGFDIAKIPDESKDALDSLRDGKAPDNDTLDVLVDYHQDDLGTRLTSKLRKLGSTRTLKDVDFISGVTRLALELLVPYQQDDTAALENLKLQVQFEEKRLGRVQEQEQEALAAFQVMYGGIETLMPAVAWKLDQLWRLAEPYEWQGEDEEADDNNRTRILSTTLYFQVALIENGKAISPATLEWVYRTDSPPAATLANLQTEHKKLSQGRLPVPIYNTCPEADDIGDLDLHVPLRTFGLWFTGGVTSLKDALTEALEHRATEATINTLTTTVDHLELAWGEFVQQATENGLLVANLEPLLTAYEALLGTSLDTLKRGQEVKVGSRILTQAWMVGSQSFEEWAVMPLLHPLKLHWWQARNRFFNQIIRQLLDPKEATVIVDDKRLRADLSSAYSSANYPAVMALPGRDQRPAYFLPVDEVDGYELYRRENKAGIAYGLDPDLVSDTEGSQAADIVASDLARVVQDYIETYPFVQDGLEIYVLECRNSALPGKLVEHLDKMSRHRKWNLNLSLIVQAEKRGAPLYRRLTEWLHEHEAFVARPAGRYFPNVLMKVLQCSLPDELFRLLEDTDIVILPDVLAEQGQHIESIPWDDFEDLPLDSYLPVERGRQKPFEQHELTRDILLTTSKQPKLLRYFYNFQQMAESARASATTDAVGFQQRVSLLEWETLLNQLHEHFNWVVCYDTTIDRFLLEQTFPEAVQVIRYSLGLGPKKRYKLTVSSSRRAQEVVVHRLTRRLENLLPDTPTEFRAQVAQKLVDEARQVSGDIVLRAAGPGTYLNELIGLIAAKYLTQQRYESHHPDALTTWIYLDDYAHWFRQKFPDLLFVAILPSDTGDLSLYIEVIETKCVGEANFTVEAADAQKQVAAGVNRLAGTWASGRQHLDADYWYDQLYQAVVGNLAVEPEQMSFWERLHEHLPTGKFTLHLSGHAYVFCYDSPLGFDNMVDEGDAKAKATDFKDLSHRYHHRNRAGLRAMLRNMVGDWEITAPDDAWLPEYDMPPATPDIESDDAKSEAQLVEPTITPVTVEPEIQAQRVEIISHAEVTEEATTQDSGIDPAWLRQMEDNLSLALRHYNLKTYPISGDEADIGPSIVRFKIRLRPGEQLSRLQRVATDLARELQLTSNPLIDNILGTAYVGIDIPRPTAETVHLLPLLDGLPQPGPAELPVILGRTPDGHTLIEDLAEFPHLLVAGATNSGKSVFLRSLIISLMKLYPPHQLYFLIVDPKRTDFTLFDGLPYLLGERVVTDNAQARDMLMSLVLSEMPRRQDIMAGRSMKIKDFNQRFPDEALPPIIAVIDEYAQLLSIMGRKERADFERDLMSLAQVARSTGIHLILATQRPSADVVTGIIKANLPTSAAFRVTSATNSRIILDQNGAENLLGRGDMLFRRPSGEIIRVQAPFIPEVELMEMLNQFKQ